jgi:hypothetical protein
MASYKRYHPVSHDFNRDPEVLEARKRFGDWIGFAWLEVLSIGDRNKGIVPGTVEQIADILAPISLQKYRKRASDTAKNFLRYAEELGWIRVETPTELPQNSHRTPTELERNSGRTPCIVLVNHAEYHRKPGTKPGPSLTPFPSPPLLSKKKEEKTSPLTTFASSFASFWAVYPKRVGKGAAERVWKKLDPTPQLIETILIAVQAQIAWRQGAGGSFRPEWKHPATWLNQRCWEDEACSEPDDCDSGRTTEQIYADLQAKKKRGQSDAERYNR